jgi:hypothetical protein
MNPGLLPCDDEYERMWKKVVMASFKILSKQLCVETEEAHDNRPLNRDSDSGPPEYDAEKLTATLCYLATVTLQKR